MVSIYKTNHVDADTKALLRYGINAMNSLCRQLLMPKPCSGNGINAMNALCRQLLMPKPCSGNGINAMNALCMQILAIYKTMLYYYCKWGYYVYVDLNLVTSWCRAGSNYVIVSAIVMYYSKML